MKVSNIQQLRLLVEFSSLFNIFSVYRYTGKVGTEASRDDQGSIHFLTGGGRYLSFDRVLALYNRGSKAAEFEFMQSNNLIWAGAKTSPNRVILDTPRVKLSIRRKDIVGVNLLRPT